jgi:hypothetical protein
VGHQLEVRSGLAERERHPERVEHEAGAHVAGDLPADDHPGEHVDDEREERSALPCAQVGEVPDPLRATQLMILLAELPDLLALLTAREIRAQAAVGLGLTNPLTQ